MKRRPTVSLLAFVASASAIVTLSSGAYAQGATPAPSTVQGGQDESLSTKLSNSGGVIVPKIDVDPGIHAQAPDPRPNSTPVIPPAATGGGTAK